MKWGAHILSHSGTLPALPLRVHEMRGFPFLSYLLRWDLVQLWSLILGLRSAKKDMSRSTNTDFQPSPQSSANPLAVFVTFSKDILINPWLRQRFQRAFWWNPNNSTSFGLFVGWKVIIVQQPQKILRWCVHPTFASPLSLVTPIIQSFRKENYHSPPQKKNYLEDHPS